MRNHAVLDVLGMIPGGIGIAADLMNALYYIAEGDVKQAIESVVMSAFSVAQADLIKNVIGICIGVYGIYGGLQQVGEDVDRYFANWDSYSEEERLLEAQILACHVLGLGGSIAGTLSAAEGCVKTDIESKQADNIKKISEAVTDTTTSKFDKATHDRINALIEAGVLSPNEVPQYKLDLQLFAENNGNTMLSLQQALKKLDASGLRPGQTELHMSQLNQTLEAVKYNYNSTKAYSSVYSDGINRYLVEGHHTTVAFEMLGKKSAINMNVATETIPSTTNVYWTRKWYQFWRRTIKIVED